MARRRLLRRSDPTEYRRRDRRTAAAMHPAGPPHSSLTNCGIQPRLPVSRRQVDADPLPAARAASDAIGSPVGGEHAPPRHTPGPAIWTRQHRTGTWQQHHKIRGQIARREHRPAVMAHRCPPLEVTQCLRSRPPHPGAQITVGDHHGSRGVSCSPWAFEPEPACHAARRRHRRAADSEKCRRPAPFARGPYESSTRTRQVTPSPARYAPGRQMPSASVFTWQEPMPTDDSRRQSVALVLE